MKRAWANAIFLAAMLSVAGPAFAQRRGGSASIPRSSAAPIRVVSSPAPRGVATVRGGGNVQVTVINNLGATTTPVTVVPVDSFPVPGLGFDFVHAAAVSRATNRTSSGVSFVPASFVGFPFFTAQPEVVVVQSPPPVIVVQAPPPVIIREGASAEATGNSAPAPGADSAPQGAAPQARHEAPEYVFVQRDGRVVFAVAFTVQGDRVSYITREGNRRALAIAAIDFDATTQMNEERGIRVTLPAPRES